MNRTLIRTLLCAAFVGVGCNAFAMTFLGMQNTGGWPGCFLGARADWSSSIGPDYQCGYADDGLGNAVGWGEGTFSSSRPFQTFDSGHTAGWELDRLGWVAGQTYSGGQVAVGASGTGSQWNSSWHMYSVLDENNVGHGISTTSYAATYYDFLPDTGENVYWAMDWTLVISTQGTTHVSAWLNGLTGRNGGATPTRTLVDETRQAGTVTITGFETGGPCTYGYSGQILPNFELGTSIGDSAEVPGQGRMDLYVNLTFGSQPVPEPGTVSLVIGLGGLAARKLRRRR